MGLVGAIIGDIIGSTREFKRPERRDLSCLIPEDSHFTDDTVLSVATKYAIQNNIPFKDAYIEFGRKYRRVGYGNRFCEWLDNEGNHLPYGSCGNGSAMRVGYIGEFYQVRMKCDV